MNDEQLLERIVCDPAIMVGKPIVAGTRLTVEYILNLLAHGATFDEVIDEHNQLEVADVQACLLFASQSLSDSTFVPSSSGS